MECSGGWISVSCGVHASYLLCVNLTLTLASHALATQTQSIACQPERLDTAARVGIERLMLMAEDRARGPARAE
jgi:hypothetical protein